MTPWVKTVILQVNDQTPEPETISQAAEVIIAGGLVAFPTETVYGLGADALNPSAVAKIFEAKQRPASDPLIVHVADLDTVTSLVTELPDVLAELAERFWPGPLTLVLPRSPHVPDTVTAGGDTVAVRMPSHPVALALIRAAGTPVAAPSANRFGHVSPTSATHVYDDLKDRVDLILDGGITRVGIESTVLSLVDSPLLLRPGGISREALESVLGPIPMFERVLDDDEIAPAPGTLFKHYAPRAKLLFYTGSDHSRMLKRLRHIALDLLEHGATVGVLAASEDVAYFASLDVSVQDLGALSDLEQIARSLFSAMRHLEDQDVTHILAYDFGSQGLGLALRDRMTRAAAGQVEDTDATKKGS